MKKERLKREREKEALRGVVPSVRPDWVGGGPSEDVVSDSGSDKGKLI